MSGTEETFGGNVWRDVNCKENERFDDCAERLLYPKSKAARLEFSSTGVRFTKVPPKPKIPQSFIYEPYGH